MQCKIINRCTIIYQYKSPAYATKNVVKEWNIFERKEKKVEIFVKINIFLGKKPH